MALSILSVRIASFPSGTIGGSTSQTVKYNVETNEMAPSTDVIEAAWQTNKLPRFGETFTGSVGSKTFSNAAIFATEFKHTNTFDTDRNTKKHAVEVTFESADVAVGQDGSTTANPNRLIDPLDRPDEKTVEYLVAQEEIREATNLGKFQNKDSLGVTRTHRPAGTVGPITNTAGFPVKQRFFKTVRRTVYVWRKYVSTIEPSLEITRAYEDTYNEDVWQGAEKHHAAFQSAEISGPEWWQNQPRYLLTVRVAESNKPWYFQVDNVGDQYFKDGEKFAIVDSAGIPLEDVPLTLLGEPLAQASETVQPILLNYSYLTAKTYASLATLIEAYK